MHSGCGKDKCPNIIRVLALGDVGNAWALLFVWRKALLVLWTNEEKTNPSDGNDVWHLVTAVAVLKLKAITASRYHLILEAWGDWLVWPQQRTARRDHLNLQDQNLTKIFQKTITSILYCIFSTNHCELDDENHVDQELMGNDLPHFKQTKNSDNSSQFWVPYGLFGGSCFSPPICSFPAVDQSRTCHWT